MNNLTGVDKILGKELDRQNLQLFNKLNDLALAAHLEGDLILSENVRALMMYVYNKNKKQTK